MTMQTATRVLIIDQDAKDRKSAADTISQWGYETAQSTGFDEGLTRCRQFQPTLILCEFCIADADGFSFIRRLRSRGLRTPVVLQSNDSRIDLAVEAVHRRGAYWMLRKPLVSVELRRLFEHMRDQEGQAARAAPARPGKRVFQYGGSEEMLHVQQTIERVAATRAAVLIHGESGTGKDVLAHTIHRLSYRAGPFVAINAAGLPEGLIESELFGFRRGTFTGASADHTGLVEQADGGTLFLDEIGEMPAGAQAKMLRVLEDSRVQPLGGELSDELDFRVISATNRNLTDAIRHGTFRNDLFHRLNVIPIHVPPLRARKDDIPDLAESLCLLLGEEYGHPGFRVGQNAMELLLRHAWPGNVRELRNVLERALILSDGQVALPCHLPPALCVPVRSSAPAAKQAEVAPDQITLPFPTTIRDAEESIILATLALTENDRQETARITGVCVKTIHARIKAYRAQGAELVAPAGTGAAVADPEDGIE
ncbi:sigma-54-dependent transcriptional regulator [Paludibaculum fermentans]|uniref:Sigma-54-dependent Fis family transcriptional regulator n=1 Tax=Paludibaculum fermentans TaxID=1473598 RepID=A0A7S7SME5_PALFE|nr:sigma-54 dependent transcriptional regulator [Paludibaculum fermentans]QOY89406.1 sigma-54-dependent Fis family transcriptional regulator [Paludibaculum fermentans]